MSTTPIAPNSSGTREPSNYDSANLDIETNPAKNLQQRHILDDNHSSPKSAGDMATMTDEDDEMHDGDESEKHKTVDKNSQAVKNKATDDSGRTLMKQKSDPMEDPLTIGDPWKHKEKERQNFYIGDPAKATTTSSSSSTAGSTTEQEGGDFWGRMGMLFQTMNIDLSNDWDEKTKLHKQYVDKKITMEKSE